MTLCVDFERSSVIEFSVCDDFAGREKERIVDFLSVFFAKEVEFFERILDVGREMLRYREQRVGEAKVLFIYIVPFVLRNAFNVRVGIVSISSRSFCVFIGDFD